MNVHFKLNKEPKTYQVFDSVLAFIVIKIRKLRKNVKNSGIQKHLKPVF
jgi:hypothetical protein